MLIIRYDNNDIESLKSVLSTNQILTSRSDNSITSQFEKCFAEMNEVKYSLAVTSGTAGLYLSLLSCGIKPGDEVLVDPIYRFGAYATIYCNAIPMFYDVDIDSYMPTVENIAACISKQTKAIIITNLFGCTSNLRAIKLFCENHGIFLIEDCAHSIMCRGKEKMAGSYGDMAVYSFQSTKHLSLGEGGMIVTNNEELHRNALLLHNLGASKKIANQYSVNLNLGWNFRIPELVSAVGLTQLKKINEIISYHKLIGDCFNSILTIDDFIPQKHMYSNHVYWRWVCRVKDPGRFLYLEEKFKDNKLMHFGHNRKNTVNDFELIKRYRNKDNCSLLINANKVVNEILSVKIFYGVKVDEYKNLAMAILK